jgi:peptidoglycan hydrolase-like protein with peptidoglycan-binding domain
MHVSAGNSFGGYRSSFGVTGLPGGPSPLPYPVNPTPANAAMIRNNAWATYNASLRRIPTAPNPNRLAARQQLVDPNHFVERPTSSDRYNFQFSDNEVRSVQAALRRMGIYTGQVDGILGPDTQRSIEDYQVRNKRPVTGTPDQWLNASLGIF